jgi:hypothetical protein
MLLRLACSFLAAAPLFPADVLTPLAIRSVKVGGEIGRRIDATIRNNLLVIDVERDFLAPLSTRDPKSGYIGLGKLLMSAVRFGAYTGDPQVLALKERLVRRLVAAQAPDGYLGFFSPANRMTRLWDVHEAGYLIAGLTDDYLLFGEKGSLAAAVRSADYVLSHWNQIPGDWGERTGVAAHVAVTGLERTMLQLARATGDKRYAEFVEGPRALGSWNLPIVIGRRAGIEGHIYAYMARSLAQLEMYRMKPAPPLLAQADRALDFLGGEGMAVTGGAGQWEIWTDDQDGRGQLAETCATAYQLRVYDSLLRLRGDARYGDLIERTVFNTLFAAQSPDGRRIRYYSPTEGPREYHPVDTYCCPTNYRRIVSELPEMVYYRRGNGAAVVLFSDSEAQFELSGQKVRLKQETDFPNSGSVVIRVDPAQAAAFPLDIRIPAWAAGAALSVNGEAAAVRPGGFATIDRKWKTGDRVELKLPMRPRLVLGRQRQAGRAAVLRGPIVYALNPTQNPELAKLDAADLGRYTIDPGSLELVSDGAVRPGGTGIRAGAWRPGYGTAAKHDLTVTLTEFPDPGATTTYFKLRDLSAAMDDELHRRAR